MKQQCPARCAERQISEFIQDHQIEAGQTFGNVPSLTPGLFLLEGVDQFDGAGQGGIIALDIAKQFARHVPTKKIIRNIKYFIVGHNARILSFVRKP